MTPSLLPEFGVGIELSRRSLRAVAARKFWGKVRLIDQLAIQDVEDISAEQCAETYRAFLKRNGLESPWTVVAIPRDMFVYRELKLPASVIPELQSVMAMQVDSLHPFSSEEIVWDSFAAGSARDRDYPQGSQAHGSQQMVAVSTGIARRASVESLAAWFEDRRIPVSQYAASVLLLKDIADRARNDALGAPAAVAYSRPTAVAYSRDDKWELLGSSSSGALSTRVVDDEPFQTGKSHHALVSELERLFADLRLEESAQPQLLIGGTQALPDDVLTELNEAIGLRVRISQMDTGALAEAAARVAVNHRSAPGVNLLPTDLRRFVPSVSLVPTYALASILLLLGIATGARGTVQDWLYSRRLDVEIRSLQPRISEIESIRGRERENYNRLLALMSLRGAARIPLEVLEDLTRSLPKEAWLQSFQLEGEAVTISGSAASASGVLQAISQAKTLESPQFLSAISRSNNGEESFRIGARLKRGVQLADN